jgi:hypothetical protein
MEREEVRLEKERQHYLNARQALLDKGDTEGAARLLETLEDVDYRAADIRAGYVSVISDVGAFGLLSIPSTCARQKVTPSRSTGFSERRPWRGPRRPGPHGAGKTSRPSHHRPWTCRDRDATIDEPPHPTGQVRSSAGSRPGPADRGRPGGH